MIVGESLLEILGTTHYIEYSEFGTSSSTLQLFKKGSIFTKPELGMLLYALGEAKAIIPVVTLTTQYKDQVAEWALANVIIKDTSFIHVVNGDWDVTLEFERVELKVNKAA